VFRIDPHFLALLKSSDVACDIIELMPETDLQQELKIVLNLQLEVIIHMLEAKSYGTRNLNSFCDYIAQLKEQAARLKEQIGEY